MSREALVIPHIVCPHCGRDLPADNAHCPACDPPRATTPRATTPRAPSPPASTPKRPIEDDPFLMVVMLLFGIGPLALPMLWRGHAFSTPGKLALTTLVFGLMALIAGLIYYVCAYQLAPLADPNLWR